MSEPLFVSQGKLEEWVDKGEVTFDDNVLTLLHHDASYLMAPAAKVTSLLDGADTLNLLGRVWKITEIEAKGAEYFHDSIIVGDTAYQCEAGFVGAQQVKAPPIPPPLPKRPPPIAAPPPVVAAPQPKPRPPEAVPIELTEEVPPPIPAAAKAVPKPAPPPPPAAPVGPGPDAAPAPSDATDMDLLTNFLLNNL